MLDLKIINIFKYTIVIHVVLDTRIFSSDRVLIKYQNFGFVHISFFLSSLCLYLTGFNLDLVQYFQVGFGSNFQVRVFCLALIYDPLSVYEFCDMYILEYKLSKLCCFEYIFFVIVVLNIFYIGKWIDRFYSQNYLILQLELGRM